MLDIISDPVNVYICIVAVIAMCSGILIGYRMGYYAGASQQCVPVVPANDVYTDVLTDKALNRWRSRHNGSI